MKLIFNQKELLKSLEEVQKAINTVNIYLPLRYFYFEVQEDKVIIRGTDGNFSIEKKEYKKPGILEIEEHGKYLIPSSIFINIIRKCKNNVKLEVKNSILYIINELDNYEINLISVDDFPNIDFSLFGNKISINSKKLREAIKNVIFAATTKENEIILNGINFKLENKHVIITATDSYRLARESFEVLNDEGLSFDITIYSQNIKELIPLGINDEVILYVNDHKINLVYGNLVIQSKIIEAPYKNVSAILEKKYSKQITIDKKVLNDAISKATVIASDEYNKIRLEISQKQIIIISIKDEVGSSKVIIPSDQYFYNGEEVIITLNFKYLKDALNVFEGEILINLNQSQDTILIESKKTTNKQIISPLRSY